MAFLGVDEKKLAAELVDRLPEIRDSAAAALLAALSKLRDETEVEIIIKLRKVPK